MAGLAASVYGNALFELALEGQVLDELSQEVSRLAEILRGNEEFSTLINHPRINKEEKLKFAERVFKGRISSTLSGLLYVVIDKGRYQELPNIFQWFQQKVNLYKKRGNARVVSAVALKNQQKIEIEKLLLESSGLSVINVQYVVDMNMLGGMIAQMDGRIFDSTIKSKLEELKKIMIQYKMVSQSVKL